MMKICVFGAGNIGGTLGSKWALRGHEVTFVVRDPEAEKVKALLAKVGDGAGAGSALAESDSAVAGDAEVVLFAVPGRVMPEIVGQAGADLNGKILIDATNNIGGSTMHQLDLLRQAAPDSPLFRAFSNLGWENFAEPIINGEQVDLFYCGDGGPARSAVEKLIIDIGLHPVYIGDAGQAAVVDGLTRVWFALVMGQGYGRHTALKLLTN